MVLRFFGKTIILIRSLTFKNKMTNKLSSKSPLKTAEKLIFLHFLTRSLVSIFLVRYGQLMLTLSGKLTNSLVALFSPKMDERSEAKSAKRSFALKI